MANVEIRLSGMGTGSVIVDGVDISKSVRSMEVRLVAGEPSRVIIELPPGTLDIDLADATVERGGINYWRTGNLWHMASSRKSPLGREGFRCRCSAWISSLQRGWDEVETATDIPEGDKGCRAVRARDAA